MVVLANYSYTYLKPSDNVFTVYRLKDVSKSAGMLSNISMYSVPLVGASAHSKTPQRHRVNAKDDSDSMIGKADNVLLGFVERAEASHCAQQLQGHVRQCSLQDFMDAATMLSMPCTVIVRSYCDLHGETKVNNVHYELFYKRMQDVTMAPG